MNSSSKRDDGLHRSEGPARKLQPQSFWLDGEDTVMNFDLLNEDLERFSRSPE